MLYGKNEINEKISFISNMNIDNVERRILFSFSWSKVQNHKYKSVTRNTNLWNIGRHFPLKKMWSLGQL